MGVIDVAKYPGVLRFLPVPKPDYENRLRQQGVLAKYEPASYMTPDLDNRYNSPYCPECIKNWQQMLMEAFGILIHRHEPPYLESIIPNVSSNEINNSKLAKIRCPVVIFDKPDNFSYLDDKFIVYKNFGEPTGATILNNGKVRLCSAPFFYGFPDPDKLAKGFDNFITLAFIHWVGSSGSSELQQKRIDAANAISNPPLMVFSSRELTVPDNMEDAMVKVLTDNQEV